VGKDRALLLVTHLYKVWPEYIKHKLTFLLTFDSMSNLQTLRYWFRAKYESHNVLSFSLSFRSKNESNIIEREAILKRSHDLTGSLLQIQKLLHSLRVKVNIAG
jgi:hypothetical protein